jgi:hypothetical protein
VERADLLDQLVALAREAGLEVRAAQGAESGLPLTSGVCRVRGALWVVVVPSDPLEDRIEVVAEALRTHASAFLEARYLPPALRERLEAGRGS